jgi:hypothetical protein
MVLALAAGGCSAGTEGFEQNFDDIKRELTQVRASTLALQDRLDGLEESGRHAPADLAPVDGEESAGDRPNLEVVHLMPEPREADWQQGGPASEEPANDEEPVVIKSDARGVAKIQDPNKKPRGRRR